MNNHFKIVIPFYNVEKWVKFCIRSIKAQKYKDFQCILINDLSTDSSLNIVQQEILGDSRFCLIDNQVKSYALKNIYNGITHSAPSSEDIIITVDGDDWLANENVLQIINDTYVKEQCWLTYGSYAEYPSGVRGKFSREIPQGIISSHAYRDVEWMTSHLRTFKYHLWSNIRKEDLLDSEGKFYKMAWDLSFMFPMLEMAGNKSKYINDILYIYNVDNPINDHKVDNSLQIKLEREIRNRSRYLPLRKKENIYPLSLEEAKHLQILSYNRWINDNGEYTHRINYDLNEESVVVDWGGFKGEWAEQIYNKYKCNVHVYEAFEKYALLLQDKFSSNPKVRIYNFGVGSTTRKVDMIENDLATKVIDDSFGKVLLVATDEIMSNFKFIDLLKINIEGLEYEVLDKMFETEDIKKVKNIQVQFHAFDRENVEKYNQIRNKLQETHSLSYEYEFIWENWVLKP